MSATVMSATAAISPRPASWRTWRRPSVIPGFGITFGFTLTYLSLIVLIPLAALVLRTTALSWQDYWAIATNDRVLAALYRPVWTSAIVGPADFALGIVAFLLLALWAVPPWLVVVLGALAATALASL